MLNRSHPSGVRLIAPEFGDAFDLRAQRPWQPADGSSSPGTAAATVIVCRAPPAATWMGTGLPRSSSGLTLATLHRCWTSCRIRHEVHKTKNCLDALPKRLHADAKTTIASIYNAETRTDALTAVKAFADEFVEFPKATKKITDELDVLLAFYDFPIEHWLHLRTTNPISVNRPREARLAEAA